MPDVTYVGGHDAVEVDDGSGRLVLAEKDGAPVTVDAATAAEMSVSGAWSVKPASKSTVKE